MCKDKALGLVWTYGQPRHLSEMAGWTGQQKSPHRSVVPSHSPDSWAQTCLDFLVYINTLPKNFHARTSKLRTLPFSSVLPKKVISISREEGVDGGLWWSLCVISLRRMKYVPLPFYISTYCEISLIFCPSFKTPFLMQLLVMAQSDLSLSSSLNMVLLATSHRLCFKLTTQTCPGFVWTCLDQPEDLF